MMQVWVANDYDEMSRQAAQLIADLIRKKPTAVLGLATGSTPLGLYAELVRLHQQEGLDFSRVTTFNLDEYWGLADDHPASYHRFMWDNLFSKINIRPEAVHIPSGVAADLDAECARYEEEIRRAGGIDLQVLGIGHNGHIGFNEPGTPFSSRTHRCVLTTDTRTANARFFASMDQVPREAVSMGIATIMEARRILLLANGSNKASAIGAAVHGPVSEEVPASVLQRHPDVIVLVDRAAAARLQKAS